METSCLRENYFCCGWLILVGPTCNCTSPEVSETSGEYRIRSGQFAREAPTGTSHQHPTYPSRAGLVEEDWFLSITVFFPAHLSGVCSGRLEEFALHIIRFLCWVPVSSGDIYHL